jgi:hypothetical protein
MVILVTDHAPGANTEADGRAVLQAVDAALRLHGQATISFDGVLWVTTSFVNAAFLPLLERMTFDELKRRIKIADSNKHINEMIKWRLNAVVALDQAT